MMGLLILVLYALAIAVVNEVCELLRTSNHICIYKHVLYELLRGERLFDHDGGSSPVFANTPVPTPLLLASPIARRHLPTASRSPSNPI
jgi:hypothetical protein